MTSEHYEANRKFYDRISRAYDLIAEADEHKAREAGERLSKLTPGERTLCAALIGFSAYLIIRLLIRMRHYDHLIKEIT